MQKPAWDLFQIKKLNELFSKSKTVIDIGGGLRIEKGKNNRYNPNNEWLRPLIDSVDYKTLDPVPDYHPDIIGDIHDLPFADNSIDAIVCIAVLEHVKNPFKAADEIFKVLRPGGYCYIFVPFLYYYHPTKGYYSDYWRFTSDGIDELFNNFSIIEKQNVRGAVSTLTHLTPFGRFSFPVKLSGWLDKMAGKLTSNQTSGFNAFLIK